MLDEAVGEGAGEVGLARAGGHLDQGAKSIPGEGKIQGGVGLELAIPHADPRQRVGEGHGREAGAESGGFGKPGGERFRAVKGKDAAGTGLGVALVAEERFNAGGFVEEGQRAGCDGLNEIRQILGVMAGLLGDTRKEGALLFGLGNANGLAVHNQQVIAGAGFERDFAQGDPASGRGVKIAVILNHPAGSAELRVNLPAGELFGVQVRHGGQGVKRET